MNHITKYIFAILSLIMLAGCSESEQSEERPKDTLVPISITLSVPNDKSSTRVGDPGEDTHDMEDWDRLTIIVAYKEKAQGDEIHDAAPPENGILRYLYQGRIRQKSPRHPCHLNPIRT